MAVATTGVGVAAATSSSYAAIYALVDFLRNASNSYWTVAGSGDGTTGGMGMDVFNVYTDMNNANFWLVLQAPGGFQLLLRREASAGSMSFVSNIAGDYSGGSATVRPTSGSGADKVLYNAGTPSSSLDRVHVISENGNTFQTCAWYMHTHNVMARETTYFSLGFLPLYNVPSGDSHNYALLLLNGNTSLASAFPYTGSTTSTIVRSIAPTTGAFASYNICMPVANNASWFGGSAGQASDGKEWSWPSLVALRNGAFKGMSDFFRRSGTYRTPFETFDSKTRMSLGYYNVPWAGEVPMVC
jgi:hypothetical protein